MARQYVRNVVVSLETRYRLASVISTRPLKQLGAALETSAVTAVEEDDYRKWTTGQTRWVVNGSAQLHWSGEVSRLKGRVAKVVFFARHGKRAGCARIGYLRERCSRSQHDER